MSISKSLAISYLEKYGLMLINLASSLILARLLSPSEIGIFSVAAFIVSLAHTLRDLGVNSYIIQERKLSIDQLRSAQFLTLSMSWLIAGCLAILSEPLSTYYRESQVRQIMLVLVINFLVLPFGSITAALLRRDLAFGRLSIINIIACITQTTTSVLLAFLDMGVISLAWGSVAGALATTGLSILYRRPDQPWRPGTKALKKVLDKGAKFSGASIFYDIGQGTPELIAAKAFSFHEAGLLSRGIGTVMLMHRLLADAAASVMVSHFAYLIRNQPRLFQEKYISSCKNMATLTWPAFACLAFVSTDLIKILYGNAWIEAGPLASILCISAAAWSLSAISGSVIIGSGQATLSLKIQATLMLFRFFFCLFGSQYGALGIATGMAVADVAGSALQGIAIARKFSIKLKPLIDALIKPLAITGIVASLTHTININLSNSTEIIRLTTIALCITTTWFLLLPIFNQHLWNNINEFTSSLMYKFFDILKKSNRP